MAVCGSHALFQPDPPPKLLAEISQCAVLTEELEWAEYAFKVYTNPYQHPAFDQNIHHILVIVATLSTTCGGVIYMAGGDLVETVSRDTFETFRDRLLHLIQDRNGEVVNRDMIEIIQTPGNMDAWGVILLRNSGHKGRIRLTEESQPVEFVMDMTGSVQVGAAVRSVQAERKDESGTRVDSHAMEDESTTHGKPETDDTPVASPSHNPNTAVEFVDNRDSDDHVVFSSYDKLDWTLHKRDWESYVRLKQPSTAADVIESCGLWQPSLPMRVSPTPNELRYIFRSDSATSLVMSKVDTGNSGFAIVCKSWRYVVVDHSDPHDVPPGHICDILTVTEEGRMHLWVIVSDTNADVIARQSEYLMVTGRMLKYQLARHCPSCPSLHVGLLHISKSPEICTEIISSDGVSWYGQSFLFYDCEQFKSLQNAIARTILDQKTCLNTRIGEQLSVTLSMQQAIVMIKEVQVNYISGPAGSGKSLIALQLYRRYGRRSSVYICTSSPFMEYLKFNGCEGLLVHDDDHLCKHIDDGKFQNKTCVIIDDSHNLGCSRTSLKKLFGVLKEHRCMSLYVFADNDYQSYDQKRQKAIYECLHDLTREVLDTKMRVEYLTDIYRNSKRVISFVQSAIEGTSSTCENVTCANNMEGEGMECVKMENLWSNDARNGLVKYLQEIFLCQSYKPTEIAVLLEKAYDDAQVEL